MSAEWPVREAEAADFDSLLKLERACEGAPHWSERLWRQMLAGTSAERVILLAEQRSELAGFVVVELAAGIASLESIAVHPGSRGQGIGHALVAAAMQWARNRGAGAMELEVRASNAIALRFYRRLGFGEQGRRPVYYAAPVEDAVLMAAVLR